MIYDSYARNHKSTIQQSAGGDKNQEILDVKIPGLAFTACTAAGGGGGEGGEGARSACISAAAAERAGPGPPAIHGLKIIIISSGSSTTYCFVVMSAMPLAV
jgi:hypothetical protein